MSVLKELSPLMNEYIIRRVLIDACVIFFMVSCCGGSFELAQQDRGGNIQIQKLTYITVNPRYNDSICPRKMLPLK